MEIPFNLRTLLEKNSQVVLPGIGVFYKKRTEGFFDENRNSFFPPKEDITFNYNPNAIDTETASEKENSFIANLAKTINEAIFGTGEIAIEGLGNLKKKGDVIVFEKTIAQDNINSSFFGLPVLSLPEEKVEPQIAVPNVVTPLQTAENFSLAEQALSVSLADTQLEEENLKSITWLYVLLSLIILALGAFAVYQYQPSIIDDIRNQLNPEPKKVIVPVATIDTDSISKQIADSIYNQEIEAELKKQGFEAEKAKDSVDVSIQTKVVPKKNATRYEIIVSAWKSESKALTVLKNLKENGIDAHIVKDSSRLMPYKISVATLYTIEQREKELKRVREELNPEAFYKEYQ